MLSSLTIDCQKQQNNKDSKKIITSKYFIYLFMICSKKNFIINLKYQLFYYQ